MKEKIIKGLTGLIAAAALTNSVEAQNGSVWNNIQEAGLDGRAKVEYNGNFDTSHTLRETIAFGREGVYDGRTSVKGQFFDIGRLTLAQYPDQNRSQEMFGLRLEPQKTFGLTNNLIPASAIVFGSVTHNENDSVEAIASEAKWSLDKKTFYLRGELQNGNQSLSHLGGTFRYDAGNWAFQLGEEHVFQNSGDFNQILVNASITPTRNDFYGFSVAHQNLPDKTSNKRFKFTTSHFGKDATWGHRSWIEYSFNPEKDQEVFSGQIALVPLGPATYGKISARLHAEDIWENDSVFKVMRTPFGLFTEGVPHFDRIVGGQGIEGLGFVVNASSARTGNQNSKNISGQVHYIGRLPGSLVGQNEYGVYAGSSYTDNNGNSATYLDTGTTLRFGKHFSLRAGLGIPIQTETKQNLQGVLEAEFKF